MSDDLSDGGEALLLAEEQVRFFRTFGFVVLRQHFTEVEMSTIDAELAGAVERTFADRPFDERTSSSESLQQVSLTRAITPFICALPEGPQFYGIARQLYGADAIGHESSAVLYVGDTRWHADRSGTDIQVSDFGCKFCIYPKPLGADTGALSVMPGSFSTSYYDALRNLPGIADDTRIGDFPGFVCHTEPGDVVLFNLNCWHASQGGRPGRILIDVVYYNYPKTPQHLAETRFTYARQRQMAIENALSRDVEPPTPTVDEYLARADSPLMKTWLVDRPLEFGFFDFDREAYIEECLAPTRDSAR
mgnify:CR=1 FL=1